MGTLISEAPQTARYHRSAVFFSVVLRAAVMLRLFAFAMSIAAMKRQAVQPFSPEQLDLDTLHEKHHISSIELCWAQGSCPVL